MSVDKLVRPVASVVAVFLVVAAANYYMDLGWFGSRGKLVLILAVLLICILLALWQKPSRKDR